MADNDGWSDDEKPLPAPKYIMVGRVTKDFIPETNKHLTLMQDELVYVFKKTSPETGFWEGETRGEYGLIKADHIQEVKP